MSFNLPLTQTDRNFLVATKEDTQTQNVSIEESSVTLSTEISKLLLVDVPFKKELDPIHVDIYAFEEELRRLNGTSILQPLQEKGFSISNTSGSTARLYLNDERLIIKQNNIEIVNVPLIPVRGYSKSTSAETNFDIWSRDRFGSTTSAKNSSSVVTIDSLHKKLAVVFDGTIAVEVDVSDIININQIDEIIFAITAGTETSANVRNFPITTNTDVITMTSDANSYNLVRNTDYTIDYLSGLITFLTPVAIDYQMSITYENQVTLAASGVASTIQVLLQGANPLLTTVSCIFNETLKTFTIVSAHGGPTASAQVVPASSADLMSVLGFNTQYQIQGKFQNNLLNVSVDGAAVEVKIADFRLCFQDSSLGYNNDDIGFDWSGDTSKPLGYIGYDRVGPLFCSGLNNGKDIARSIEAQLKMIGTGGFKNCSVHYFTDDHTFVIYSGTMGTSSSIHVLPASDSNRDARTLLGFNPPLEERGNEEYFETLQKLYNKLATIPNTVVSGLSSPSMLSHSILYQQLNGDNINSDFQDLDLTTTKVYDDGSRGLPRLFPNGKLTIDSSNDKINFFEILNVERTATIIHDTYEGEMALALAIQNILNYESSGPLYLCNYDFQQKKFTITSDGAGGKIFSLLWQTGKNALTSIGNYIGFDVRTDKTGALIYSSDSQITFSMKDYFYPFFSNQFDGTPTVHDDTVDEQSALAKEKEYLQTENSYLNHLLSDLQIPTYENQVRLDAWEYLAALELAKVNQEFYAIRAHRGAYANHISESDAEIVKKTIAYENVKLNKNNLDSLTTHLSILNINPQIQAFVPGVDFSNGGLEALTISVAPGSFNRRIYNNPMPLVKYTTGTKHIPGVFWPSSLMTSSSYFSPDPLTAFSLTNTKTATQGYSSGAPTVNGYDVKYSSNTAATILSANSGTYDMSSGDNLKMKIDGETEQTVTFNATPGYTEGRLAVTNQFVIKTGINDKLDFYETLAWRTITIPQGSYNGATLASTIMVLMNASGSSTYSVDYNSSLVDRFRFTSNGIGGVFSLLWSSGSSSARTIGTTLGFDISSDDTGLLIYSSDYQLQFCVLTSVNDTFTIRINGILSNNIIISQGYYSVFSLISELSTKIANDPHFDSFDFTITYPANKFRITSTTTGIGSRIEVYEGVSDFLRTITLDGDAPVFGGGNVLSIDAVTVDEVVSILNGAILGISASNDTNKVKITTTTTQGSTSTIEITGGTCTTIIGFNIGLVYGFDQNNRLKVEIDSDTSRYAIEVITNPALISGNVMAADIQSKLAVTYFGGNNTCAFNEHTAFHDFANSLRIISGAFGASSSVYVSDHTLQISFLNRNIDFEETIGVQLTAVLSIGYYNATTLAQEIKTQLEAVGAATYTVTYSTITKKITISSSGSVFRLLFGTGTNASLSTASTLGFYQTNQINSLTYTGIGSLKLAGCTSELGFDTQIAEPGHNINDVTATMTDTAMTTTISWLDNGGGSRLDLNIDLTVPPTNNIAGLISAINADVSYTTQYSAFLLGRVAEKFRISDGDSFSVDGNSVVFSAKRAYSFSGAYPCTRVFQGVNDVLKIQLDSYSAQQIQLGTQLTSEKIAAKIQQEVRNIVVPNIELQSAFLCFTCYYDTISNCYVLLSGNGGTSSKITVSDGSWNSAASSLKLGIANGGTEADGSGSDVINSNFVTVAEIVSKLSSSFPGVTVSGPTYLRLQSNSRIVVDACSLKSKLGFDENDDCNPVVDFATIDSSSIRNFTNQNIKSPAVYTVMRGWETQKGNVNISYFSIDDEHIVTRLPIVSNRLAFIPTREAQIPSRVSAISPQLTPALYTSRKDAVRVRINKKTGSYSKVGSKFVQQDNNASTIETNTQFISSIDSLL